MAFRKRSRQTSGTIAGRVGAAGHDALIAVARLAIALSVILILSAGVLYVRLSQGPVALPALGKFLVERANASSETVQVAVNTVVLDLGDGTVPTGLEFRDVRVNSVEGAPLFVVPRVRASFDLTDLVRGEVRPTRISVVSADAQFIRGRDGRMSFGLGHGDGVALDPNGDAATTSQGVETIAKLIDGLVGDTELAPEIAKLKTIEVLKANIYFEDRLLGGEIAARHANLRIRRDDGGATALLDVAGGQGVEPGEIIRVVADRRRGGGITSVAGRFGRLDVRKLVSLMPGLERLRDLDTRLEGEIAGRFGPEGRLLRAHGVVIADGGTLSVDGKAHPFDIAAVTLAADMAAGEIEVANGVLSSRAVDARLTGLVRLERDGEGLIRAANAQLDVDELGLGSGAVFERPVRFDQGQLVARWTRERDEVTLAESWLARGDMVMRVAGRLFEADGALAADMRAEAEGMDVRDLVTHWPVSVATNAREWVAKNITKARLDALTAELRLRGDETVLALTTGFSGLTSTYIDGMSPIEEARGELFLDLEGMHLSVSEGTVVAGDGQTISIAGSDFVINDLVDPRTDAHVRIRANGSTAAVLALIDQKPLYLVRALGLDLNGVKGASEVTASLSFPLLDSLQVEDVEVNANAVMSGVSMAMDVGETKRVDVRSDRLEVAADVRRMRLTGDVLIDGAPATLDWREDYSARPGQRQIRLAGVTTPALIDAVGLDNRTVGGSARITLDLDQRGDEDMRFALDADLAKAALRIDALKWSKTAGTPGKLTAEGKLGRTAVIDKLTMEAPGLSVAGAIEMSPQGGVRRAVFSRINLAGRLDAGVTIQTGENGVPDIGVTGRFLDVSGELDGRGDAESPRPAFRMRLALQELHVTESIVIRTANGQLERLGSGALTGAVRGALGPDAPVEITLDLPAGGEGRVTLTSPNAGAALHHADIYHGASGGTLRVDARIPEGEGEGLSGRARIDDVVVRSQSTFKEVLEDGGLPDAGAAVSGSGLSFRSISIPFRYRDGVVTVTDAIATSPALGLKMTGTLDERTDAVDMAGVLSPAYVLTGALNEIPLLGEILSGGRGEGIVAMTFTLKGAMGDPTFSVNPLSLLAPGVLRRMFTGLPEGDGDGSFKPKSGTSQR